MADASGQRGGRGKAAAAAAYAAAADNDDDAAAARPASFESACGTSASALEAAHPDAKVRCHQALRHLYNP